MIWCTTARTRKLEPRPEPERYRMTIARPAKRFFAGLLIEPMPHRAHTAGPMRGDKRCAPPVHRHLRYFELSAAAAAYRTIIAPVLGALRAADDDFHAGHETNGDFCRHCVGLGIARRGDGLFGDLRPRCRSLLRLCARHSGGEDERTPRARRRACAALSDRSRPQRHGLDRNRTRRRKIRVAGLDAARGNPPRASLLARRYSGGHSR